MISGILDLSHILFSSLGRTGTGEGEGGRRKEKKRSFAILLLTLPLYLIGRLISP